ncbi:MAG: 2-hydroxychromene-2-carboxylate isomerase, partial [Gammaproteobacteria bacterium]|nr:2-hydroxychromene-2-carboxylate isomerase [Gammaproteobacteria bacterium]
MKAEFLFDFGSPNAYIAHTRIPGIESRTGVTVEYVPVLLGGVFKLTGNVSPVEAFKSVPAKLEYFSQDIRDWVEYLGIPYRRNPHFPVMTLGIMRGAVALLGTDRFAEYVETVFRAMWVDEKKMDDPAVIGEVLAAAGFDAEAVFARTREPEVK